MEKAGHEVITLSREEDLKCFSTKAAWWKLRKKVKEIKPDIIYTHDWSCALPILLFKNHFVHLYGFETENPIFQKIVGRLKGKKVTITNKTLKKQFPKATVSRPGVDLDEFYDMKQKRTPNSVGFANWETDFYSYDKIKKAVENLGYIFITTGMKLKKEDIPKFYNKIETFISLPPKSAGFNMSWIEAMACGVPKIIGNYNGVGKILDINHVEDFENIEDALKNAGIKKNYKIDPKFNWEVQTNKILELFYLTKKN